MCWVFLPTIYLPPATIDSRGLIIERRMFKVKFIVIHDHNLPDGCILFKFVFKDFNQLILKEASDLQKKLTLWATENITNGFVFKSDVHNTAPLSAVEIISNREIKNAWKKEIEQIVEKQ